MSQITFDFLAIICTGYTIDNDELGNISLKEISVSQIIRTNVNTFSEAVRTSILTGYRGSVHT